LRDRAEEVSGLLRRIRDDVDVRAKQGDEQLALVGPLWRLLHELPGVGDIRASKLLARKRPRLVPITDSIIESTVGTPGQTWPTLQHCFKDASLRKSVGKLWASRPKHLTVLRVFDVAMWMLFSQSKAARKARRDVGLATSPGT
jgi:hypothetical protein